MRFLSRYWVFPKLIWGLFIFELPLTIAILALFGIASPDTYRTKLWQEGANHGWNSNPNEILYSYANHNPINTPLVWSSLVTNYNVVISVLSMFILLTKTTLLLMRAWFPIFSFLVHGILAGVYAFSIFAQAAPDTSDPAHKQTGAPWYITKSCSVASTHSLQGYCRQAKAAFSLTCIMLALFFFHICWSVYSNFFGKRPRGDDDDDDDDDEYDDVPIPQGAEGKNFSPESDMTTEQQWEMQNFQAAGIGRNPESTPFTPRTQAFHKLGGGSDLPLRQA